ncbi:MAG TPA: hypothetical protein VHR66_03395 [Gemmataceae bacterium]|jgi:hypothetical protein|nr:hypothetical protein [Gemmataceae bacterium]
MNPFAAADKMQWVRSWTGAFRADSIACAVTAGARKMKWLFRVAKRQYASM